MARGNGHVYSAEGAVRVLVAQALELNAISSSSDAASELANLMGLFTGHGSREFATNVQCVYVRRHQGRMNAGANSNISPRGSSAR